MVTKHTAGLWTVDQYGDSYSVYAGTDRVAYCYSANGNRTLEEARRNAYVIAAAPELLEACQAALMTLNINRKSVICPELESKLRSVIAKAEGPW